MITKVGLTFEGGRKAQGWMCDTEAEAAAQYIQVRGDKRMYLEKQKKELVVVFDE